MASSTNQMTKNSITLRGSTAIVSEFFGYALNSILYQRGVYPEESFEAKKKYNLQIMVTKTKELQAYLNNVLQQIEQWLMKGDIQKLVLVIASIDDGTVLERWLFNIETDKTTFDQKNIKQNKKKTNKSIKDIQNEIRGIIRQITSSVTFLPLLEVPCSFDLLVHTDAQCKIPKKWQESQPKYITNSEMVRLRSFNTSMHKVDAMVSYKVDEDDTDDDQQMFNNDNANIQSLIH
eukprot:136470_1